MNEKDFEKLTDKDRELIELFFSNERFGVLLLATKTGMIARKNLEKQKASADFIAQYERMESATFDNKAFGEAWLIGFRMRDPKAKVGFALGDVER